VTEIAQALSPQGQKVQSVSLKHLCPPCAQQLEVSIMPAAATKNFASIMSMLKSAGRERTQAEPPCPQCGMTLAEFRSKGRLGCAHDYEHFAKHIDPLLQRMHSATRHLGRIPGLDAVEQERRARLGELRQRLEVAIRDEAYETAARLRDELVQLDQRTESKTESKAASAETSVAPSEAPAKLSGPMKNSGDADAASGD
jgi:protein arginine kinase activator